MFSNLTEDNVILYAMKHYENSQCLSEVEFHNDLKIIKYIKNKTEEIEIPTLNINEDVGINQIKQLKKLKRNRNQSNVNSILQQITKVCGTRDNLMPYIISAAKEHATVGEIIKAMKNEFGEWQETVGF